MTNEEAIKILDKEQDTWMDITNVDDAYWTAEMYITAYQMAIEALENAPKKGKWEKIYNSFLDATQLRCSVCSLLLSVDEFIVEDFNFCPYCGARMEKE